MGPKDVPGSLLSPSWSHIIIAGPFHHHGQFMAERDGERETQPSGKEG